MIFICKHTLIISGIIFKNESNFEHNLEKNRALLVAYFATFTSTIVKGLMLPCVCSVIDHRRCPVKRGKNISHTRPLPRKNKNCAGYYY